MNTKDDLSIFQKRLLLLFDEYKQSHTGRVTYTMYAEHINISFQTLRGWFRGTGEPSLDKLAEIAKIENVTVDWLIGNSNERQPARIIAAQGGMMEKIATADSETLAKLEQYYNYLQYQKEAEEHKDNKA